MKKLMAALSALALSTTPVLADPEIKEWNTYHSMGCMLERDCQEGVVKSLTIESLEEQLGFKLEGEIRKELEDILGSLKAVGVEVFVSDPKYFVSRTRGIYYTPNNKFFLNPQYITSAESVLNVIRHEGWHAAQDCMAGSIENSHIAVIWNDGVVPNGYQLRAEVLYGGGPAVPWEKEAMWAMETEYMTANALRACAAPEPIWDVYTPTPMTGEWLVENGYWDGVTR